MKMETWELKIAKSWNAAEKIYGEKFGEENSEKFSFEYEQTLMKIIRRWLLSNYILQNIAEKCEKFWRNLDDILNSEGCKRL